MTFDVAYSSTILFSLRSSHLFCREGEEEEEEKRRIVAEANLSLTT
jgi:hypothetical protein